MRQTGPENLDQEFIGKIVGRRKTTRITLPREQKSTLPSNLAIARFLSASFGGALVGGIVSPFPLLGALLGAVCGAGVVMLRTRHAH